MLKETILEKISKEEMVSVINNSSSYNELYRNLGYKSSVQRKKIIKRIIDLNLDISILDKFKLLENRTKNKLMSMPKEELVYLISKYDNIKSLLNNLGYRAHATSTFFKRCEQDNIDISKFSLENKLINRKYQFITVKSFHSKKQTKTRTFYNYNCECDCGKTLILNSQQLQRKSHCGCKNRVDIVGLKINMLTCTSDNRETRCGHYIIKTVCDCGREKEVLRTSFLKNLVKSCGCIRREVGNKSPGFIGVGELSGMFWSSIRASAAKRNLEFKITMEEAWELFEKQNRLCALSGLPLVMCSSTSNKTESTASLDRIDSKLGYNIENVQWVHKTVNKIKSDYSDETFIDICKNVFINNFDSIESINKPEWVDYFLGIAFLIAQRSSDAETKHGCLIVDSNNRIVGTGYNSFPKSMPDNILANKRPKKYNKILHAELNCLLNSRIESEKKYTAFITGKPCLQCIYSLWNAGITNIYCADREGSKLEGTEIEEFDFFLKSTKINFNTVRPKLDFLIETVKLVTNLGYINSIV